MEYALSCWILGFHIFRKLGRSSSLLEIVWCHRITVLLMAVLHHETVLPCAVRLAIDLLRSLEYSLAKKFSSRESRGSAFNAVQADSCQDELISYPKDRDGDHWVYADLPVDYTSKVLWVFVETSSVSTSCAVWPMLQFWRMSRVIILAL